MKQASKRIRIGSGGVLYLIVSSMILASAFYTQANLLFWGFGLTVGGLVVSVGAAAVALNGLQVTRVVPRHGATGEIVSLRYELTNRSWLPMFGLVINESTQGRRRKKKKQRPSGSSWQELLGGPPHAWLMHLGPRQSVQTVAPCRPQKRGCLTFERIEVSTSFPFGVIHKSLLFDQDDTVQVLPSLYRVRRQLLSGLSTGGTDSSRSLDRGGGSGDFFGVREYRPGDSPRNIDWKRTARTGDLVSRERTLPSPPVFNLLLDLGENPARSRIPCNDETNEGVGREDLEERAISLAASLICDGYMRGFKVGLRVVGFPGVSFRPQHSLYHRVQLLEALAGLDLHQPRRDVPPTDLRQKADVVVWTGLGSSLPSRLHGLCRSDSIVRAADFDRYVLAPSDLKELLTVGSKHRVDKIRTHVPVQNLEANRHSGVAG